MKVFFGGSAAGSRKGVGKHILDTISDDRISVPDHGFHHRARSPARQGRKRAEDQFIGRSPEDM